jgi:hypothetical protein
MADWKTGTSRELIAELRKAGALYGHSGKFPKYLRLHKTDIVADIRALPEDRQLVWKIGGDPTVTGRYGKNPRHVILWLGQ